MQKELKLRPCSTDSNSGHNRTKNVLVSSNQPSVWGRLTLKLFSDLKWIAKVLVISIFDYSALCVFVWDFCSFLVVFPRFMIVDNPDISWCFYLFSRLSTSLKFFRLGTTLPIDLFVNLKTFIKLLFHAVLRNTEALCQRVQFSGINPSAGSGSKKGRAIW